jgi:hypothetical protein
MLFLRLALVGNEQLAVADLLLGFARGSQRSTGHAYKFFTLMTAGFVTLKVMTSYEIPPVPDGFITLMGISNGVYLGSEFAK